MRRAPFVSAAAMIAVVASGSLAAAATPEAFRAQGNEPSWSLQKTAEALTFGTMAGQSVTVSPVPEPTAKDGAEVFAATVDGKDFTVTVADKVCVDNMSGMPFPLSVSVAFGGESFRGCGGEPASLLQGAWRVTQIDGKPVLAKTEPTLDFAADGQVSGNGSCNRFFGGFKLTGEGLGIGPLGASMMACEEPVMKQERLFHDILEGVIGFAIEANGALVLKAADDRAIGATR